VSEIGDEGYVTTISVWHARLSLSQPIKRDGPRLLTSAITYCYTLPSLSDDPSHRVMHL